MRLEFTTNMMDVFTKDADKGVYAIITKSPWFAGQCNKVLKHYAANTTFQPGEEPLFRFSSVQIQHMRDELDLFNAAFQHLAVGPRK